MNLTRRLFIAACFAVASLHALRSQAQDGLPPAMTRSPVWDIDVDCGTEGILTFAATSSSGLEKAKQNAVRCAREFFGPNCDLTDPVHYQELKPPADATCTDERGDAPAICPCATGSQWLVKLEVHFCCNPSKSYVYAGATYCEAYQKAMKKLHELKCSQVYGPVKCSKVCVMKKPTCCQVAPKPRCRIFSIFR